MRHLVLFVLLLGFAGGCSKKKAPEEADPGAEPEAKNAGDTTAKDRAFWFKGLASKDAKTRQEAADELTVWVATDPETVDSLLDLLQDKTTTGAGKALPNRFNSNRELAVEILNRAGPVGQAALKDKGLPILREELNNPDPVIREHTLHAIGTLGTMAKPLTPDVLKLCTSTDLNVHRTAFDTLKALGGAEPLDITTMLTLKRPDVARLAAEQLPSFTKFPDESLPHLVAGLKEKAPAVRVPCAAALATFGPKAAPALDALIKAINESYPKEVDPTAIVTIPESAADAAYWNALAAIGEPAVIPTAGLLKHTNPFVRTYAAQTLGEIGEPSKAAADKLKAALMDSFGNVAIEAACTLCRIGEGKEDAIELVKRAMDAPNSVAQTAIEAIPRMGEAGKPLIPVALAKLKSENPFARYAAIGVVATLEPMEAAKHVTELGKLVTDTGAGIPDAGSALELRAAREIRQRAVAVLMRLGPLASPAAEAVSKAIPNEPDSGLRDQLVEVIVRMGVNAKPAYPVLLAVAQDSGLSPDRRAQLFDALTLIAPGAKEVATVVLKAANEVGSPVRYVAISKLGKFDPMPPEVLTKLVEMATTDRATNVRVAALRALSAAGPRAKPVRADIEKIANGNIPEFALTAKVALAGIDGNVPSVAGDVRAALTNKNTQVRQAAVDALALIGPELADVPALQKLLTERSDGTKEAAARCVEKLGPVGKDAVPQLVKLLDDREGNVRIAAATALGEIGPAAADAVPKLRAMRSTGARKNDSADPVAGPAAAIALAKIVVKDKK